MSVFFTATNEGLQAPDLTGDADAPYSFCCWVRLRDVSDYRPAVTIGITDGTSVMMLIDINVAPNWRIWNDGDSAFFFASPTIGTGEWWFLAFSQTAAGSANFYYAEEGDTALTADAANPATFTNQGTITGAFIGRDWLDPETTEGDIAYVKVWSEVLSEAEFIHEWRRADPVRLQNLTGFYSLGTTAGGHHLLDLSGNDNDLTAGAATPAIGVDQSTAMWGHLSQPAWLPASAAPAGPAAGLRTLGLSGVGI